MLKWKKKTCFTTDAFFIPAKSMLNKYFKNLASNLLAARAKENFDELYNSFLSNEKKHTIHLENGLKREQSINLPRAPM